MSVLSFHLACDPPTATAQQRKHRIVGKGANQFVSTYKPANVRAAERLLETLLLPHRLEKPIQGPISAQIDWVFPWRASETKKIRSEFARYPKDTQPDADNSNKLLLDIMERLGFYSNDAQIYDLRPRKWWGDKPGISVVLRSGDSLPTLPRKEGVLL